MTKTKILNLIPESLRADLIDEVKEMLNAPKTEASVSSGLKKYLEDREKETEIEAKVTNHVMVGGVPAILRSAPSEDGKFIKTNH